ncbi:hypothetical protein QL285_081004 [Trifolium repens]|nr:hypothetical protein QL285_081004 [Trifolium repens]
MQPTSNSQQTPPLANFWLKQLGITQTSYKDTYITNTSSHQHEYTKEEKRSTSSKNNFQPYSSMENIRSEFSRIFRAHQRHTTAEAQKNNIALSDHKHKHG